VREERRSLREHRRGVEYEGGKGGEGKEKVRGCRVRWGNNGGWGGGKKRGGGKNEERGWRAEKKGER